MNHQGPGYDQFSPYERKVMSGLSLTSMILGIIGFFVSCCGLLGIPVPIAAIICGHLGVKDCNENPEKTGKGMAIAGLIMGYGLILLWVAFYLWASTMDPEDMEQLMQPILEKLEEMGGPTAPPVEVESSDLPEISIPSPE